jgi:hypothetical protein
VWDLPLAFPGSICRWHGAAGKITVTRGRAAETADPVVGQGQQYGARGAVPTAIGEGICLKCP